MKRRDIRYLRLAARTAEPECAQPPGRKVGHYCGRARHHGINMPAEQVVECDRRAFVRHVQKFNAGHRGKQRRADMWRTADAGRSVFDLAGPRFGECDEFLHRTRGHRWMDDQQIAVGQVNLRYRREIIHSVVREFFVIGRVRAVRTVGDQQGVTIFRRARHRFGADGAAGTRAVVKHQ